jgi:hypothetical protein
MHLPARPSIWRKPKPLAVAAAALGALMPSRWLPPPAFPLAALLGIGLAGCSVDHPPDIVLGPAYVPSNIHREAPKLPAGLRRVAVLPLATSLEAADDAAAREALEPILGDELAKTKRFELVKVSPQRLEQRTGRSRWTADEKLPPDFLAFLREAYACDAVLFSQITAFRAYPPLAVGWRFKLVTADGQATPWAADEVFDAGQPAVVNGARLYHQEAQRPGGPLDDSRSILSSPRRFGRYSASVLLAALPTR